MPGVFQLSVDEIVTEAGAALAEGVPAVLLFGLPPNKDDGRQPGLCQPAAWCRKRCAR